MYTTLIEPTELAAHAGDPGWAILDCRFELGRPEWGLNAYADGHIPQALYAHLDHDLSGPVTPSTGRHPLPSVESFARTAGGWGIDDQVQVVAYDQRNGAYAARLWCLLRWAGHSAVAVLNGGFAAWQKAGLAVSAQPAVRQPRRFNAQPVPCVVTTGEVERWVADGAFTRAERILVDARGADRFQGENETLDPVAGHVPGARNDPFASNVDADGRFLPADALRTKWLKTLGGAAPSRVISMCGSGVTACHNLLALEIAGLPGARLYAGSWSEWIRDPAHAIARGP
jgi:thiosulfate/3-mercaptopyruvate sulfurtransferase